MIPSFFPFIEAGPLPRAAEDSTGPWRRDMPHTPFWFHPWLLAALPLHMTSHSSPSPAEGRSSLQGSGHPEGLDDLPASHPLNNLPTRGLPFSSLCPEQTLPSRCMSLNSVPRGCCLRSACYGRHHPKCVLVGLGVNSADGRRQEWGRLSQEDGCLLPPGACGPLLSLRQ